MASTTLNVIILINFTKRQNNFGFDYRKCTEKPQGQFKLIEINRKSNNNKVEINQIGSNKRM